MATNAMISLMGTPPVSPVDLANAKTAMYREQLGALDVQEAQRQVQSNNAMRQALSAPGAIDPQTGMPTANTMGAMMQADPTRAMAFFNKASAAARAKEAAALEQQRAAGLERDRLTKVVSPVTAASVEKFESLTSSGVPVEEAMRQTVEARNNLIDDLAKGGDITPQQAEKFKAHQFNPYLARFQLSQLGGGGGGGKSEKKTRTRIAGDQEIQEEFDPIKMRWLEIGRGPRFARQVPAVVNVGGGQGKPPSGYRWGPKDSDGQTTLVPIKGGPADTSGASVMDKADKEWWADRVLGGGAMPSFGMGKSAAADRKDFLKFTAQRGRERGISGADSLVAQAGYRADSAGLSSITRLGAQVLSFEDTAVKNLRVAMKEAENYARTGVPIIDRAGNLIRKNLGDKDFPALQAALTTVRNEYSKISASATAAGAGGTRADREEIDKLLSSDMNIGQLRRVVQVMEKDMKNRRDAIQEEKRRLEGSIRSRGGDGGGRKDSGGGGSEGTKALRDKLSKIIGQES